VTTTLESQPAHARSLAPLVGQAIRIWLRYLAPMTLLSVIALAPIAVIALRTPVPLDLASARATVALAWKLIAFAWLGQLVLVGGASAVIGAPSQLGALGGGLLHLVRAILPCFAAAAAIAIGSLALVVPGLVLLVLLALTGASRERGVSARLVDSIAVARGRLVAVALAVGGMLAIDAAIGIVAQRALIPQLPRRPGPGQLAATRQLVHAIAIALVVASPLPAIVLALLHRRGRREDRDQRA
jgi:hypothetical protein